MKIRTKGLYKFNTALSRLVLIVDDIRWHFLGADGYRKPELTGYEATYYGIKKIMFSGDKINTSIPVEKKDLSIFGDNSFYRITGEPYIIGMSSKKAIVIQPWSEASHQLDDLTWIRLHNWKIILIDIRGIDVVSADLNSEGFKSITSRYPVLVGRINNNKAFTLSPDKALILNVENNSITINEKTLNIPPMVHYNANTQLSSSTILFFSRGGSTEIKVQLVRITENDDFVLYEPQEIDVEEGEYVVVSYFIGVARLSDNKCIIFYRTTSKGFWRCRIVTVNVDNNTVSWENGFDVGAFDKLEAWAATPDGKFVLLSYTVVTEMPPFNSYIGEKTASKIIVLKISGNSVIVSQDILMSEKRQDYSAYFHNAGLLVLSNNSFLYTLAHASPPSSCYILTIENSTLNIQEIDDYNDEIIDVFNLRYPRNFIDLTGIARDRFFKIYNATVIPPIM